MARSRGDVAFVLLLIQAAAGILGALSLVVLTGSPPHAVVAVLGPVLQVMLAMFVARGSRSAWALVIASEALYVYGFVLNGVLGLVPQLDVTVTFTGLITGLALPLGLIVLGVLEFAMTPQAVGR